MSIKLISKHRSALMAIAMLWIALEHSYFPVHNKMIAFVFVKCGYGGVSFFVFLSAFGLYYSYKKDSNYWHFIKKRLLRILPFSIPIALIQAYIAKDSLLYAIADGLGLSLIVRANLTNWFTSFILIAYLFTPLYLKIFNKKPLAVTITGVIVVSSICLFCNISWDSIYAWFHLVFYFLGFYFAYLNEKDIKINVFLLIALFVLGWLAMYYMYHNFGNEIKHIYPMLLIAPSSLIIGAYFLDKMPFISSVLKRMGEYTYQFYLIHKPIVLNLLYANYGLLYIPNIKFDIWINVAGIVIAYILSALYKKLIDFLINKAIYGKGN